MPQAMSKDETQSALSEESLPLRLVPSPPSCLSLRNRMGRAVWSAVWVLLFRPSPRLLHGWRRFLLRLFGARIGRGAIVRSSARIWAPWNLEMGDDSCLGEFVDCYSVDRIRIGPRAWVSQYSFLCTASHDFEDPGMPLITAPITIEAEAWVAVDVFVGPGVTVGRGAMVGARSSVFRDVAPWTVVAGNPPRTLRKRVLRAPGTPPAKPATAGGHADRPSPW